MGPVTGLASYILNATLWSLIYCIILKQEVNWFRFRLGVTLLHSHPINSGYLVEITP